LAQPRKEKKKKTLADYTAAWKLMDEIKTLRKEVDAPRDVAVVKVENTAAD
jgi:hypothetical protein